MEKSTTRFREIDLAKGIGILFVIIGHILHGGIFRGWIYSFHMPLFFFLSGAVYKQYDTFKKFLISKIRGILIPYWLLGIVLIAVDFMQLYISGACANKYFEILFQFFVYGRKYVLWFLPCLFFVNLLFWVINHIPNFYSRVATVLLLPTAVLIGYHLGLSKLPWSIDTSGISVFFFGAGYFYSKYRDILIELCKKNGISFGVEAIAINIVCAIGSYHFTGYYLDMNSNKYGVWPLTILGAFAGIVFIMVIAINVKASFLEYVGKNSITYFALHYLLIRFLNLFIEKISINIPVFGIYFAEFFIVVVVLTELNAVILKSPFSVVLGKKRSRK